MSLPRFWLCLLLTAPFAALAQTQIPAQSTSQAAAVDCFYTIPSGSKVILHLTYGSATQQALSAKFSLLGPSGSAVNSSFKKDEISNFSIKGSGKKVAITADFQNPDTKLSVKQKKLSGQTALEEGPMNFKSTNLTCETASGT